MMTILSFVLDLELRLRYERHILLAHDSRVELWVLLWLCNYKNIVNFIVHINQMVYNII